MLQFLVDTLIRAADLALVAVGLSSVYALMKFPNIAHVQYAAAGAFITYALLQVGMPFVAALAVACVITGVLATALNILVFERLLRSGPAIAMIGSLAVSMIMVAIILGWAGSRPLRYPFEILPPLRIGDARISQAQIWSIVACTIALATFATVLFKTSFGRSMRALAANAQLAAATGVNGRRITNSISFISGAFAALGGTLLAMTTDVHMNLGNDLLLPVFAAAILGGLGNPMGAVLGAVVIALGETAITNINFGWLIGKEIAFLPVTYISAASFLVLVICLLFRPQGLLSREVRHV